MAPFNLRGAPRIPGVRPTVRQLSNDAVGRVDLLRGGKTDREIPEAAHHAAVRQVPGEAAAVRADLGEGFQEDTKTDPVLRLVEESYFQYR